MKYRQKLCQEKPLLDIFLWIVAISLPFSPVLAESPAQVKPDTKPLRLETFTDRKSLNKGEEIGIKVWIDSTLINRATVTVFFPKSQLELKEDLSCQDGRKKNFSCEVNLPRSTPVNFAFIGKKIGKFSVLIQVSGEHTKTKKEITERQQIQDIEVKAQAQWWSKLLSSPLLGVFIGGALTIITTVFTNYLQSQWAKRQRRQWILTNLPAQLEVTRQAISQRRETGFELWMDKLRTEGYYTELQRFATQKPGQENLAERLLKVAFHLRDYEHDRKNFPFKELEVKYGEIAQNLDQIIRVLNPKMRD